MFYSWNLPDSAVAHRSSSEINKGRGVSLRLVRNKNARELCAGVAVVALLTIRVFVTAGVVNAGHELSRRK